MMTDAPSPLSADPPASHEPASHEEVMGVVLAGGLSRRMGGGDKALLSLGGRSLLRRVIDRLEGQVGGLVINANGDAARFAAEHLPVVRDSIDGHPGPLAGVLAGLEHAADHGWRWVATVPVDVPFLPLDLVDRLMASLRGDGAEIACAASGERVHPVVALWPVAFAAELRRILIETDERRVDAVSAARRRAVARWSIEPNDPFFNVNSKFDLDRAERGLMMD